METVKIKISYNNRLQKGGSNEQMAQIDECFNLVENREELLAEARGYSDKKDFIKLVEEFIDLGGKITFINENINFDKEGGYGKVIDIRKDDLLYPICHEGENRSQVLYVALQNKYKEKFQVEEVSKNVVLPHGASGGYDPYQSYKNLKENNWFGYVFGGVGPQKLPVHPGKTIFEIADGYVSNNEADLVKTEGFKLAFGQYKKERYGEKEMTNIPLRANDPNGKKFDIELNCPYNADYTPEIFPRIEKNRKCARTYFDETFWNTENIGSQVGKGRRVYFTFARATEIAMQRLIENSKKSGKRLDGKYIVAINWDDKYIGGIDPNKITKKMIEETGIDLEKNFKSAVSNITNDNQNSEFKNFLYKNLAIKILLAKNIYQKMYEHTLRLLK